MVKYSDGSVSTEYLVDDPLGSTAAVAAGAGALTKRIAYGAGGGFVNPVTGTGSVSPRPLLMEKGSGLSRVFRTDELSH